MSIVDGPYWGQPSKFPLKLKLLHSTKCIWVRSRRCSCLVTWFCYQLIAKPGNKAASHTPVTWPKWSCLLQNFGHFIHTSVCWCNKFSNKHHLFSQDGNTKDQLQRCSMCAVLLPHAWCEHWRSIHKHSTPATRVSLGPFLGGPGGPVASGTGRRGTGCRW